ncbi:MAG: Ig-like domain-containing protein [bacterium]
MQRVFKYIIICLITLAAMLTFVSVVSVPARAQDTELDLWGDEIAGQGFGATQMERIGLGKNDPRIIAVNIIRIALGLLGILAVILIMYGGYVWMTASGDPAKVDKAKLILRNGTIGLLIILAAFAIATFILNRLLYATGGEQSQGGASIPGAGLGALGNGIVKSVYPEPGQTDVPRNTIIMVTFREEIDPSTICDSVSANRCDPGAKILSDSIKIYKSKEGDGKNNITDAIAASKDNKIFVFSPMNPLGSQTEPIYYSVYLSTDIKKTNKDDAFNIAGFEWSFEVNTKLDLMPPKVVSIFPGPDNAQDTAGNIILAKQASGSIEVSAVPRVYRANSVSYIKTNPGSVDIDIPNPNNNHCDGSIDISINNSNPLTANVAYNMPGYVDTPSLNILGDQITVACGLQINFESGYQPGHSWQITMQTRQQADIFMVGNSRYSFVDSQPGADEIEIDSNLSNLAQRIKNSVDTHAQVKAAIDPGNNRKIIITAEAAGKSGNNIQLSSSTIALIVMPMSGGADKQVEKQVNDRPDKPKNAIIQINFNEAINPLTVSGPYNLIADYIKVVNLDTSQIVSGKFVISNQYRTVEFISDNQCGINGCGEAIYCLPENSDIRVDLTAAELASVCSSDDDCLIRSPFSSCNNGICYDNIDNRNHPEGKLNSGITDTANNSLDGNRDSNAYGPISFFNENIGDINQGDSYQWSFWISDALDLTPPKILATNIAPYQAGVHLDKVVEAHFDKLLLSDTLKSGSTIIDQGDKKVEHQLVNLWSVNKRPLGYWVFKQDKEISSPPDNEPDQTIGKIKHASFNDSMQYRAHFGSGVKDIYQNCYKPSASSSCAASSIQPTCCNDQPVASDSCP